MHAQREMEFIGPPSDSEPRRQRHLSQSRRSGGGLRDRHWMLTEDGQPFSDPAGEDCQNTSTESRQPPRSSSIAHPPRLSHCRYHDDHGGAPLPPELRMIDALAAGPTAPLRYRPALSSLATSYPPPPSLHDNHHFRDIPTSPVSDQGVSLIADQEQSIDPEPKAEFTPIRPEASQRTITSGATAAIGDINVSGPVYTNFSPRRTEIFSEIDRVSPRAIAEPPAPRIASAPFTSDEQQWSEDESTEDETDDDSDGGISFEIDMESTSGPLGVLYSPIQTELSPFMEEEEMLLPARLSSQPAEEEITGLLELIRNQQTASAINEEMNLDTPENATPTELTPRMLPFSAEDIAEANESLANIWDGQEGDSEMSESPSIYIDTSMEAFNGDIDDISIPDVDAMEDSMSESTPERDQYFYDNYGASALAEDSMDDGENQSGTESEPNSPGTFQLPDPSSPLPIIVGGNTFTRSIGQSPHNARLAASRLLLETYQVNPILNLIHLTRMSEGDYTGWTNDVVFGLDLPYQDFEKYNDDFCSFFANLYNTQLMPTQFRSFPRVSENAKRLDVWSALRPKEITAEDVKAGSDIQGIDWEGLEISKEAARRIRKKSYLNYRNVKDFTKPDLPKIPKNAEFFNFKRLSTQQSCRLTHFQLRNVLCVTSRNDYFYSTTHTVVGHHPITNNTYDLMNLGDHPDVPRPVRISTLGSSTGPDPILIAGGFHGNFALRRLSAPLSTPTSFGTVTDHDNGITNHIHIVPSRTSSSPTSVFCSNDSHIRLMDTSTLTFTATHPFPFAVNCAATSPCSRLRAVVGDTTDILITNAERGTPEFTISNQHQDFGFAVAWSDDGYTIATGNQDQTVRIFDARNLSRCLKVFPTKIAGCRTLRFSPNGGKRVLAIAEPADYLHIVDATNWEDAQTVEFWGEVGGLEFTPDGEEVVVANGDRMAGGLMTFERGKGGRWYQECGKESGGGGGGERRGKRLGMKLGGLFV